MLSGEDLTFRADSENGKEERNLKNSLKEKSMSLRKHLENCFSSSIHLKNKNPFSHVINKFGKFDKLNQNIGFH